MKIKLVDRFDYGPDKAREVSVEVECSEVLPITEIVRFATDLMAIARDKSLDIPPGAPQIVREED